MHNAIGNRVNATIVESVWSKMENAHKQSQQVVTKIPEDPIQNQEQNKGECSSYNRFVYLMEEFLMVVSKFTASTKDL